MLYQDEIEESLENIKNEIISIEDEYKMIVGEDDN